MLMSGREGAAEARGRLLESLSKLRQRFKQRWSGGLRGGSWLWEERRRVIGVAAPSSTGDGNVLFAELVAEGGTLSLVRTAVERLDGGLMLAEAAAMRAQREGWHELDFAACLPAEQVRFYETELPPHMEAAEWREAAHWELDARLTDEGLEADAYAMVCRREGAGRVVLAAAEREMLARLAEDFREQGLSLRGIAALPPGTASSMAASLDGQGLVLSEAQRAFVPAIVAAQSVLSEDGLRLWGSAVQGRRLRCRRLAALCCTVTFFVLFATAFFDMRAYLEAKRDYQQEEQAFLVLQREKKVMHLTGRLQQKIRARRQGSRRHRRCRAVVQRDGPPRPAGTPDRGRLAQVHPAAFRQEGGALRCSIQLCRALCLPAVLRGGPRVLPAGPRARGIGGGRAGGHHLSHQHRHLVCERKGETA